MCKTIQLTGISMFIIMINTNPGTSAMSIVQFLLTDGFDLDLVDSKERRGEVRTFPWRSVLG